MLSRFSEGHYLLGPTVPGRVMYPCGQGSEVHSQGEINPLAQGSLFRFKSVRCFIVRVQNSFGYRFLNIQEIINLNLGSDPSFLQERKYLFLSKGQSVYVQCLSSELLVSLP